MATPRFDAVLFLRVLGEELRAARKRHDLYRKDIIPGLERKVSLQTLATYEQGTRDAPISRFVEVCLAMGESPMDLMRRPWEQMIDDPVPAAGWEVDLAAAAQLRDVDLASLATWAAVQLGAHAEHRTTYLTRAAIDALAALCGLDWPDLVRRLPQPTCTPSRERNI